jgi:hypothetical protein
VKLADFVRIRRGRDGNIAGATHHPLEQKDISFQIVDNQDAGVEDRG